MVEFPITVNEKQRLAYIPKILIKTLGSKLIIVPNSNAAVIYPEGRDLDIVLKSLEIISQDLRLRNEIKNIRRKR